MKHLALIIALLLGANVAVAEPPPLRNNPFARPPAPLIREATRPEGESSSTPLIVIATMVSSSATLANIEGQVMRPGQEINGYLLKRVYEDRAVFERDGNELTVYVKPELEEDDVRITPNRRPR